MERNKIISLAVLFLLLFTSQFSLSMEKTNSLQPLNLELLEEEETRFEDETLEEENELFEEDLIILNYFLPRIFEWIKIKDLESLSRVNKQFNTAFNQYITPSQENSPFLDDFKKDSKRTIDLTIDLGKLKRKFLLSKKEHKQVGRIKDKMLPFIKNTNRTLRLKVKLPSYCQYKKRKKSKVKTITREITDKNITRLLNTFTLCTHNNPRDIKPRNIKNSTTNPKNDFLALFADTTNATGATQNKRKDNLIHVNSSSFPKGLIDSLKFDTTSATNKKEDGFIHDNLSDFPEDLIDSFKSDTTSTTNKKEGGFIHVDSSNFPKDLIDSLKFGTPSATNKKEDGFIHVDLSDFPEDLIASFK